MKPAGKNVRAVPMQKSCYCSPECILTILVTIQLNFSNNSTARKQKYCYLVPSASALVQVFCIIFFGM